MTPGYFFSEPIFICGTKQCEQEIYCDYEGYKYVSEKSIQSITYEFKLYCDNE